MKFYIKPKKELKHGDVRIKTWFAWLPITIKGETRWLEVVTVKQKYTNCFDLDGEPDDMAGFDNICFIESINLK